MNFNRHSAIEGQHAFLSASRYHWVNYNDERLAEAYSRYQAAQLGTRLHDFAHEAILLGVRLPRSKKTLNMYINDAIGFRMTPEQPLYYSANCFGTADAISFRKNLLRIHDLKTGMVPASPTQLEVYAAMFCLEYGMDPNNIDIELRIYQLDEIVVHIPPAGAIKYIMEKIIAFDKYIDELKYLEG